MKKVIIERQTGHYCNMTVTVVSSYTIYAHDQVVQNISMTSKGFENYVKDWKKKGYRVIDKVLTITEL